VEKLKITLMLKEKFFCLVQSIHKSWNDSKTQSISDEKSNIVENIEEIIFTQRVPKV